MVGLLNYYLGRGPFLPRAQGGRPVALAYGPALIAKGQWKAQNRSASNRDRKEMLLESPTVSPFDYIDTISFRHHDEKRE
jgi:hypothetical protein